MCRSPHQLVEQIYRDTGVRTNPLRRIGVTAKTEAFMEVARKRGFDPLTYRLELLKGTPRAYKVVERVAQMADWGRKREGQALGLAYIDYSGSQVAGIAEVSLRSKCIISGVPSTAASRCSPIISLLRPKAALCMVSV